MTVKELIEDLKTMPQEADVDISVDVSTGEKDCYSRVFADEVFHAQRNYKDSVTILTKGCWNKDV